MKVVLISQGSLGDVHPFLVIGSALREIGHQIVICAPVGFCEMFSHCGFTFHPVGLDFQFPPKTKVNIIQLLQKSISDQFAALEDAAPGAGLIVGNGLDYAGQSVAEYLGIPYRSVCHIPIAFKSSYHAPMTIPNRGLPQWMNSFFWRVNEVSGKMIFGSVINIHRKKLGLGEVKNFLNFMSGKAILVADSILAPLPPDCKSKFRTGYWNIEEQQALDSTLIQFLEAGTPPVYIGFGSMIDPSPAKTSEILQELIDSQRFRIIISRGWANLSVHTENRNIFFIDYVPHAKLFPKMAAIVHHGGAGTTHAAARAGIPQVIIPHALDQYYWGKQIFSLKLGVSPIPRAQLSGKKLISATNEAITNQDLKRNAEQIGTVLRQQDGLQEAVAYFNDLLKN